MRIDGSGFSLTNLWAQAQDDESLAASAGLSLSSSATTSGTSSTASASDDFLRTIGERLDALGSDDEDQDASGLVSQLSDTMSWIEDRFGSEAADTARNMVSDSTASGMSEDSLSGGLVKVLGYIDRTFGTDAGDAAISQFNTSLNGEINDYFDNGANEEFLATTTNLSDSLTVKSQLAAVAVQASGTETDRSTAETLVDQLNQEAADTQAQGVAAVLPEPDAVEPSAQAADSDARGNSGDSGNAGLDRRAMNAYAAAANTASSASGSQWLSMAV